MKIQNPEKRLQKFWGMVDKKHVYSVIPFIKGTNVLDLGCGNGSTTHYVNQSGNVQCIGIDDDVESIRLAQQLFPGHSYKVANAEELPFQNDYFDTVILRDALHHLYQEADYSKVKKELLRVCKNDGRIIILDPNINLLLKTMRKLAKHEDAECDYETALTLLDEMQFNVLHKEFHTLYSLPLSGGYVGINFVPPIKLLQRFILTSERLWEKIVGKLGLGRFLCWRYLIIGERNVL